MPFLSTFNVPIPYHTSHYQTCLEYYESLYVLKVPETPVFSLGYWDQFLLSYLAFVPDTIAFLKFIFSRNLIPGTNHENLLF